MTEEDKKTESEVTPEGAVEIQEEDLDQASGGAIYMKPGDASLKQNPTADPSVKISPVFSPTESNWDMKKL